MLAVVALSRSPVSRAKLTELLWGDRGEEQAKASLRQALYEVRDLSSAGLLTASRETVAIGPKRLWTDIGAIEAPANGSAIADLLDEAEWPPLSDLDDITPELDEWLQTERSRLSTLIMQRAADAGEGSDPARDAGLRMLWSASTRWTNELRRSASARTLPSATGLPRTGGSSGSSDA